VRSPRRLLPLALVAGLALAGCGTDEKRPAVAEAPWSVARLEGVADVSGIAVDGDALLLVAGGNDRNLHVLRRSDLRPGAVVATRAIALDVRPESRLAGTDEFAGKSYEAADLWAGPVELAGVATQAPNLVYVLERSFRVVYAGFLLRGADGLPGAVRLDRLFVVPGGDRPGRARSDWRDVSAGLAGIVSAPRRGKAEDLYAVERQGAAPNEARLWKMDRFGQLGQFFTVAFPEGVAADLGGVAWDGARFLFVRGPGRGTLPSSPEGAWTRTVAVEAGPPGPEVAGVPAWRGLARSPEGVLYLASSGPTCHVAWR
jgi:hypothetical protein